MTRRSRNRRKKPWAKRHACTPVACKPTPPSRSGSTPDFPEIRFSAFSRLILRCWPESRHPLPRVGRAALDLRRPTSRRLAATPLRATRRSEEHTSELQSRLHLVCRLLLEKKKTIYQHSKRD